MTDFEVRRDDLRRTRVTDGEPRKESAADGEVQLAVDRFGLTANNVTYGVFGEAMSYWRFFPCADPEWGRVPVWGYGDVIASGAEGIAVGERFYGYFPMSSHLTVRPQPRGSGFLDASDHRRELPAVYNEYLRVDPDAPRPDETLLLRPLFGTSFLLEAFLAGRDHFGAERVVLSSASSKTAYGLAFLLGRADAGLTVAGLTSPGNREFVASLGVYDEVVTYDAVAEALAGDDALVYVDMAGDAAVREAVHRAAGDRLRHSAVVGASHWEALAGPGGGGGRGAGDALPGPAPEFFFAPTQLVALREQLGPAELQRRMSAAWDAFIARVGDWMDIERGTGAEAVARVWRALVDGAVEPRAGHVLRLG